MNMIKGEWKKIFSKPMTIVVICGLLFVPLLYNVIFLSAYWDPYGKTDQIPVAVVNEDKGATLDGKKLNVGRDFVDDLKKNDKFDWKFTNKEKALEGLKNEDYYLVLEIPKNFSKNATTLMDKDPKKMKFIYHTNAGKNYSGAQISSNAVAKINDQIKEAVTKQYAETVFDSFKQVADGLQKASDGAGELEDGSKTLRDNMKKLADSTVTFEDGTAKLASGLTDARKGATDLNAGAAKLLNGADTINENLGNLNSGLGKLESGSSQLYSASSQLETGAVGVRDGLSKLQSATKQLNDGTQTLQGKLPQFTSGLNQVDAEVSNVTQQINQAEQEITQIKQQVDSKKAEFEQQQQALIDSINSNESIPDEQKQTLIAGIKKLTSQQFMDEQQQKAEQLKAKVDKVQELSAALQKLSKGGEDIQSAINKIADGQSQLYDGQTKVYNGAVKLADGEKQFNSKFAELNSGIADAHTGAGKLADGQQQLVDGLKKSEQGSAALANGLTQLENGATKLANGSKELTNGSSKLYDGSSKLSDGTSELHSSLANGAKDAKDVKADDKTYSMFSNPTDLKSDKQNNVDKYGVGLAPYILCIGLFAGTLMFSSVYPLKEPSIRPTSGISWFLSKFSVIAIVGILQAAIAVTALLWGLHLNVTSIWHFYIFTMITGVTFFALILFLTTALGKVGQYLAFIILLLQIGGSAGTFPKALVPEFFQAINPYLPMTYAIRGFREIISIGDDFGYVWHQAGVLGIFAAIFIVLSLVMFYINARKEQHYTEEESAA
ncbi:ABC transporter [Priestia aryabhattai]|uniref:YhgE/Pip domain-containing protein n=1 Tax=Priestia TaxID=2800373 RepID=UPI000BF45969|nr:YhgE/Pip domain-containing protein [Priestia aryabhattai]MCM3253426.1 YhgE/Pip domain-containing protein [Priestia aryabhattai]MCM3640824.1 YhgE/Pip domain-containing protein [Priestia aryabhattai]PFW80243.1 ABC transporter [Priestia aryabhattai]